MVIIIEVVIHVYMYDCAYNSDCYQWLEEFDRIVIKYSVHTQF